MSEKRKSRRSKDEYVGPGDASDESEKPSKEEYAVAKWLKKNVRTKKTKFLSHNVEYFTATKALDGLMKSKFAEGDKCLFASREQAIEFLDIMLEHRFFHRAKKIPVFPEDLKGKSKKLCTDKEICSMSKKESTKCDNDNEKEKPSENQAGESISNEEGKEKRKRKIKLDMHPEQIFVDGSEAYVWIYDPVPIQYWIYGMLLVLAAIVICLFPLWPPILRKGVYYLSVAAAGFLVFILTLTLVRLVVFVIVWLLTLGKLYFWIFPNLTEDVGFFASFWPLYESEYHCSQESSKSNNKKSKKKKKDKDSDAEEESSKNIENIDDNDTEQLISSQNHSYSDNGDDGLSKNENENGSGTDEDTLHNKTKKITTTASESESEGSRSSTGKEFELVDAQDAEM